MLKVFPSSPLSPFLAPSLFSQDCLASSNLQSVLTEIALVNLARYLSLLRDTSAKRDLLKVIPLLDQLLKRLTKPNLQVVCACVLCHCTGHSV